MYHTCDVCSRKALTASGFICICIMLPSAVLALRMYEGMRPADNNKALFGSDEDSKRVQNCLFSILLYSSFWFFGLLKNLEVTSAGDIHL